MANVFLMMLTAYLLGKGYIFIVIKNGFNRIVEIWIADARTVKARKQVGDQTKEQGHIFKDEFR